MQRIESASLAFVYNELYSRYIRDYEHIKIKSGVTSNMMCLFLRYTLTVCISFCFYFRDESLHSLVSKCWSRIFSRIRSATMRELCLPSSIRSLIPVSFWMTCHVKSCKKTRLWRNWLFALSPTVCNERLWLSMILSLLYAAFLVSPIALIAQTSYARFGDSAVLPSSWLCCSAMVI